MLEDEKYSYEEGVAFCAETETENLLDTRVHETRARNRNVY